MQKKYLSEMRKRFQVPILPVPLFPREISGKEMLVSLGDSLYGGMGNA